MEEFESVPGLNNRIQNLRKLKKEQEHAKLLAELQLNEKMRAMANQKGTSDVARALSNIKAQPNELFAKLH